MAELRTLARPYAKAAFQAADQKQALSGWADQLTTLAAAARDEALAKLIASPSISAEKKAEVMAQVLGDSLTADVKNFIAVLSENGRLPLLPSVAELFDELKANKERSVDVTISSAFDLGSEAAQALHSALKAKLNREINVETHVDKALLGGVLVKAGDIVIDGSVKGRLAKLAEAMNL